MSALSPEVPVTKQATSLPKFPLRTNEFSRLVSRAVGAGLQTGA